MDIITETPKIVTSLSDWKVEETPIYGTLNGKTHVLEGFKALVRSDNGNVLNVCKPSYTALSNASFIEATEKFSDVTGFPIMDICEIDGGKKALSFLKCTETVEIDGFEFKDYLMLGNSHDGSTPFFCGNSNMMIRCKNRFARAFRSLKARHSQSLEININAIQTEFANYKAHQQEYYKTLNTFKKVEVSEELKNSLRDRLAGLTQEERLGKVEINTKKKNIMNTIDHSFSREMSDLGFNLYGLFGGVTHYTTHALTVRKGNEYSMFNRSEDMNLDAYSWCKSTAKTALLGV